MLPCWYLYRQRCRPPLQYIQQADSLLAALPAQLQAVLRAGLTRRYDPPANTAVDATIILTFNHCNRHLVRELHLTMMLIGPAG